MKKLSPYNVDENYILTMVKKRYLFRDNYTLYLFNEVGRNVNVTWRDKRTHRISAAGAHKDSTS